MLFWLNRRNGGRSSLMWRWTLTVRTAHWASMLTRSSSVCCFTCVTKMVVAFLTCAVLAPLSTSNTAFATGSTTSTAKMPPIGKAPIIFTSKKLYSYLDYFPIKSIIHDRKILTYKFVWLIGSTWTNWPTWRILRNLPESYERNFNQLDWAEKNWKCLNSAAFFFPCFSLLFLWTHFLFNALCKYSMKNSGVIHHW